LTQDPLTPFSHLSARLDRGEVVVIDGATGTELQARGVPMDEAAWCGVAALGQADVGRQVHEDYIRAGAAVVIANSYATNRFRLTEAGFGDRVEEANRNAVRAAIEARSRTGRPEVAVAGSISSAAAFTVGGTHRGPAGETLLDIYSEQAAILADAGVDLLALEMISGLDYGELALRAARNTELPIWLGVSAERARDGRLICVRDEDADFDEFVEQIVAPDLAAVLVMHTDVADANEALESVFRHFDGPVGIYPHVGRFVPPNWEFDESFAPQDLVALARRWVGRGVRVVGGCCGLGPDYIRALAAEYPPSAVKPATS
jgi:S-methylmethionine-dependent homocysteine/selenocysteine methylase